MSAWVSIYLSYAVPCMIGKHFDIAASIVKIALQADQAAVAFLSMISLIELI